jgi:glycosyltransferase 2 family protein
MVVLLGGLALLGGMGWQVGLTGLWASLQTIGPWIVPFILLDRVSRGLHTVGWAACFQHGSLPLRLWHLVMIRMAGSAVNWVTPPASIGGERAKVFLLGPALPRAQATAAVVIDKASVTLAQVVYLAVGTLCLAAYVPMPAPLRGSVRGSLGVVTLGLGGCILCQRYGILSHFVPGLRYLHVSQAVCQRWRERLAAFETDLGTFYGQYPWRCVRSVGWHVLALLCDAIQTYLLLELILDAQAPGLARSLMVVVAVATLEQMFFFVSGSLGTLEVIRFTVLSAVGIAQVSGLAFGLVARLHNVFWNGLGLVADALCTPRIPGVSVDTSRSRRLPLSEGVPRPGCACDTRTPLW